jgi:phage gp16-like protein
MRNALAAIHVARKELGMDEDTYRAFAVRVTGKTSARDMSEGERGRLLEEMRRQGFKGQKKRLEGPFASKLQALWIAAWNLGVVADRRDEAMLSFVKRQTHIDHTRFLLDGEDAAKAVDALKAWMTREASVDWSTGHDRPDWLRRPGAQIAVAQWNILVAAEVVAADIRGFRTFVAEIAKPVDQMTDRDWHPVMNALGERVRKVKR